MLERKSFIKKLGGLELNYNIDSKPLGKGTYGEVYCCTHKVTKEQRVVKVIHKGKMLKMDSFLHEIDIMKRLVH